MALSPDEIAAGKRVSIALANEILKGNPKAFIVWRPEEKLPEESQYAVYLD